MNKEDYMKVLEKELKRLPQKEREQALRYYREYFEDSEHEEEAAAELGDPKAVAAQVLRDLAVKQMDDPGKAAKRGLSTLKIVILGICAAPVGLPLMAALICVILALALVAVVLVLAIGVVGIALSGVSVLYFGVALYLLFSQPVHAVAILGGALVSFGTGVLFLLGMCLAWWLIYRGMRLLVKRVLTGGKRK